MKEKLRKLWNQIRNRSEEVEDDSEAENIEEEASEGMDAAEIISRVIKVALLLVIGFGIGILGAREVAKNYGEQKANEQLREQLEEQSQQMEEQSNLLTQQSQQMEEQSNLLTQQSQQMEEMNEIIVQLESQLATAKEEASYMSEKVNSLEKYANQIYLEAKANLANNLKQYHLERGEATKSEILLCEDEDIYLAMLEVMQSEIQGKDYSRDDTDSMIQDYCYIFSELCPQSDKIPVFSRISSLSSSAITYRNLVEQLEKRYDDIEEAASIQQSASTMEFYILKRYEWDSSIMGFFRSIYDNFKYDGKLMYLATNVVYKNGIANSGTDYYIILTDNGFDRTGAYTLYVNSLSGNIKIPDPNGRRGNIQINVYDVVEQNEEAVQDYNDWNRFQLMLDCCENMLEKSLSNDREYVESVAAIPNYLWMLGTWSGIESGKGNTYTLEVTDVTDNQITFHLAVTSAEQSSKDEVTQVVAMIEDGVVNFAFSGSSAGHEGTGTFLYSEGNTQGSMSIIVNNAGNTDTISLETENVILLQSQYERQLQMQ